VKDITGRPEHMFRADEEKAALKTLKNKQKRLNKAKKLKEAKALLEQQTGISSENSNAKELNVNELAQQLKKMTKERAGDWTCQRCGNHNFSFRYVCNKCQLTLEENDEMLVQHEASQPTVSAFSPQSNQPTPFVPSQMPV
jgi:DNA-directed RNA polymerase subunit M/transcription elongation factor TFIIS